jgi:hypothetical protein
MLGCDCRNSCPRREWAEIKILVAFEDEYRAYRGTLAAAIRILYSHAEVEVVEPETLEEEVKRFKPEMVISSRPRIASSNSVSAWVELSLDYARPTKLHVGRRYSEVVNPTIEELFAIIDELEQLTATDCDN